MPKGIPKQSKETIEKRMKHPNMQKVLFKKGNKFGVLGKGISRGLGHKPTFNRPRTEDEIRRISIGMKGKNTYKRSKETKERMRQANLLRKETLGYVISLNARKKISKKTQEFWNNPQNKERRIKAILKGLFETRPTSLEQDMIDICKKHNLPFIYTGDGRFLIGYKNPDFVNKEKKIAIEVANIFHHNENYPQERKDYFKKYGWDCIVFRTDKLNEEEVVNQLKNL
ncbi:MAG: hypothetical protein AABY22_27860 [Nanoarchaeota archaeon]